MIYAIDFDGTIVEDKYPEIGKPNERLISYLKHLKKKGHTLILWTCRVDKDLDEAVEFCKSLGIEFDYINENAKEHIEKFGGDTRKIFADYYIDDKAMDYRYFESKAKRIGDLFCKDIKCAECPIHEIRCRGTTIDTLYENLEKTFAEIEDDEIYNILKARLDKEVKE